MVVLVYNKTANTSAERWRTASREEPREAERDGTESVEVSKNAESTVVPPTTVDPDGSRHRDHAISSSAAPPPAPSAASFQMEEVRFPVSLSVSSSAAAGTASSAGVSASRSLLQVAEVRADQQAACRDTMLNLKDAFETALGLQAQMESLRQQDLDKIAQMEAQHLADQQRLAEMAQNNALAQKIQDLEAEIEILKQKEEDEKVAQWREKLMKSKGAFNLVMHLSRDAHPVEALVDDAVVDELRRRSQNTWPQDADNSGSAPQLNVAAAQGGVFSAGSDLETAKSHHQHSGTLAHPSTIGGGSFQAGQIACGTSIEQQDGDGSAASGWAVLETTLKKRHNRPVDPTVNAPTIGAAATASGGRSIGDNLTLSWVLKLWKHHIKSKGHARSCEKATNTIVDGPTTAEGEAQTELDLQSFEDQILDLQHDLKESEELRLQAEEERDTLLQQLVKRDLEKEHLSKEISRIQKDCSNQLRQKDIDINQLRQKVESQQDALQRAQAAWETEKRNLKATIRDITSDLQQALTQARRMELLCQKLKKEGGAALKEKLAQLIADLELAKNKLSGACKERDQALDNNDYLNRRLGQTTRKMELERQFLPLIHLAKGPVGQHTNTMNKTSNSKSEPKLPSLAHPELLA